MSAEGGDGRTDTVGRSDTKTSDGESRIPLQDALPTYVDQATEALDRPGIPPSERDQIKDYFDSLQGN